MSGFDIDVTIRMLLEDFHTTVLPAHASRLVNRDLSLGAIDAPEAGNLVKVIVGMRRSGKTYRLFQEILRLEEEGISENRICYFNFDDDRLRPYPSDAIDRVLEIFFELNPIAREQGAYLFFDEVQDVPGWDITARRIVDTEKATMFVTGSSSRLLSSDVATEFRGRSVTYELLPFSFRERVRCDDIGIRGESPLGKVEVSKAKSAWRSYLVHGGFPASMGRSDDERVSLLQSYVQMTVARDAIERHRFSNPSFVANLARIAVSSSGRDFSISRIDGWGKSLGYSPGRAAIAEMVDALEDAHLVFGVFQFTHSVHRLRKGGYKLYAVDPGAMIAMAPATTDGLTRALETAVYLELRRRFAVRRLSSISMLKLASGREVDFVVGDEAFGQAYELYQVCYSMRDDATREREFAALEEAMQRFGLDCGWVITMDEEGDFAREAGTVHVVPAWKWALQGVR